MPPSASLATLRADLGGSLMEYELDAVARGMIAAQVLPVFETAKQAGIFGKIPVEQLLNNPDTERAPGSGYSRNKYTFVPVSFATEEHGLEEPVDDRESRMYADFFDAEQVAAMRCRANVLIAAEKRAADLIFNATTWTGAALTTAVTTEWSTVATATPIADVDAAAKKVFANSGMWPNTLVINQKVFRNLVRNTDILNTIKYAGIMDPAAGNITRAALAQALNIDQVVVAGLGRNTANEGASATFASVWSDEYAMICKVAMTNDIREPCIGRTLHWGEDGSSIGGTFESYRDETVRGDIVRCRHDVEEKVLFVEGGHLLSNITA